MRARIADLRQLLVDAAHGLEAREARHGEVDHRHLRPGGARLLDRLEAVRRLGHHVALAAFDEQADEALAHQGVVVGDQDPHPAGHQASAVRVCAAASGTRAEITVP